MFSDDGLKALLDRLRRGWGLEEVGAPMPRMKVLNPYKAKEAPREEYATPPAGTGA
jgi:hypothetical protein